MSKREPANAPPLCPLEARLEELLQIELAEDLEAIPMTDAKADPLYLCLTPSEMNALLARLGRLRGERGYTTDEAEALLGFAQEVRWMHQRLDMLLAGEIGVDVVEGRVLLIAPEVEGR